ncbi:MAG: N-formylglutamate amidohydrolase [Kofleriaceae bacterium]|nr:N-formylglutamate amidohydrolase [Kofleriaceae bacterium]
MAFESVPGVVDVEVVRGAQTAAGAPFDLVFEIPHGATRTEDFTRVAARMTSPVPDRLVDFFHVNTDVGAPELAAATAQALVAALPAHTVAIVRSRVPRTFIDCNRRLDASPEEFKAGKVGPGLMPWVTTAEDRAMLRALYDGYVAMVRAAVTNLASRGAMVMLHTYAPRTVDVEVDLKIVESLHRAYQPDVERTWPLRPAVDVIGNAPDGTSHAPAAVVDVLRRELAALDLELGDSATYPLHPSTLAYQHVVDHPGRALCVEFRRDLVADPFVPFVEVRIGVAKVARLAGALSTALQAWWSA